jgi:hypothetical protein
MIVARRVAARKSSDVPAVEITGVLETAAFPISLSYEE